MAVATAVNSFSFFSLNSQERPQMLDFFSDLILFTAGLGVLIFWIVLIVLIGIEVYDLFTETDPEEED